MTYLASAMAETESRWWLSLTESLILTHLLTVLGFVLALLITAQMVNERRNPSNIFAWSLLVFFLPYLGVPLYVLFGGRKSKRLVENKRRILEAAADLSDKQPTLKNRNTEHLQRRYDGNTFKLLTSAEATYNALLHEIDNAKDTIHITTYIFGKDDVARTIRDRLCKRAADGIKVRLLIDSLGSFGRSGFLKPLREAGGQVAVFMPVLPLQTKSSANLRNHRKLAIFDGERCIVGGQNIDGRFLGPKGDEERFIDVGAFIMGPILLTFNRLFLTDWCYASEEDPRHFRQLLNYLPKPTGTSEIETIPSGPDLENDPLWESILSNIHESKRSITLATPYFIPDQVLFHTLIIKARAGYKVRIIVPEKSNQPLADFARGHYLHRLDQAGADIFLFRKGMLHGKMMLFDKRTAILGSANIDVRSMFVNFEVGVACTSPEAIESVDSWLNTILADCIPYESSTFAEAGRSRRLLEDFAHLLAPLL